MAGTVNDGTYASTDLKNIFNNIINTNETLSQRITDVKNETNLFLCKVLKFYSYKDLALVQVLNDNSTVLCHLTHDILDRNICLLSMNHGTVKSDNEGTYIMPFQDVYGIVAKVRWDNLNDEYCLITCVNLHGNDDFKNVVGDGEILLKVGNSKISITRERVNIITPQLFINGLPSDAPELSNYYDKKEMSTINEDLTSEITSQLDLINKRVDDLVSKNNLVEEDAAIDDGDG